MQYISSRFGIGVSDRKLNSSIGFFVGQYHRRVPENGNFVTRRKRIFEHHPLRGFYVQSGSEDAYFFFTLIGEENRMFYSTRLASRLGQTLSLGEDGSLLRNLEVVGIAESFTGAGIGVATTSMSRLRLEVIWITPDKSEQIEQARLKYNLSSGWLISLGYQMN